MNELIRVIFRFILIMIIKDFFLSLYFGLRCIKLMRKYLISEKTLDVMNLTILLGTISLYKIVRLKY
jgi:hypothetical protein